MPDAPVFETTFYQTASGNEPAREFLRALPRGARLKCGRYMQLLEWRGLELRASHLKKLSGDIWELRPEYGGIEYRLYFATAHGKAVYVLATVKIPQAKAEQDAINLAQRRFNEWKATHDDKRTR